MVDSVSPLVIEPHLSAVAINFKQPGMIADMVLPRTPVDSQEFISTKDRLQDWITPPDTFVGRTGQVNELSSSLQDAVYLATRDQGLDERVPNRDNRQMPSNRALMRAVMRVMSLVEMRRELRAAALAANPASYASSVTLSGSAQWNDQTSDPLDVLLSYLDRPFMRPNMLCMGQDVWTQLRKHPAILNVTPTSKLGVAYEDDVAKILGVRKVLVGMGWYNAANKGQAVNQVRIWGKYCFGFYLPENVDPEGMNCWGYTAEFGTRIAGTIVDPNIGLWGGLRVRAGESVREVVAAPEFGFLIQNAVA